MVFIPTLTGIDGLYTDADRLNEIFDHFETLMYDHMGVSSLKYGVVSGLLVSDTSTTGAEVTITSGLAYDPLFKTTLLSADTILTGLTSADDGKYVVAYRTEVTGATGVNPLTLVTSATQLAYPATVETVATGSYVASAHVILASIDTVLTGVPSASINYSTTEPFVFAAHMPTATVGLDGSGAEYFGSDEVPFQQAIDGLGSGGGTIYVFSGDYNFSNDVNVTGVTNIRFWGEGNSSNINVSGGNFNVSGVNSTMFNDLKFINDVASGSVVDVDDVTTLTLQRNHISGVADAYAIQVEGAVENILASDNYFENTATGLSYCIAMNTGTQYATNNVIWKRNTHEKFNFHFSDEMRNVVFTDCYSRSMKFTNSDVISGTSALYPQSMIVSHNSFVDDNQGYQDITVANGVFTNNYVTGGTTYNVGLSGIVADNFYIDAYDFLDVTSGHVGIGNTVSGGEGLRVSGDTIADKNLLINTASGIENLTTGTAWANTTSGDRTSNLVY